MERKTCNTCGQEYVTHDSYGLPHLSHRKGKRHQLAEAKRPVIHNKYKIADNKEGAKQ